MSEGFAAPGNQITERKGKNRVFSNYGGKIRARLNLDSVETMMRSGIFGNDELGEFDAVGERE